MSITGAIKFFKQSKNLESAGASVTVTSGEDTKDYILGSNRYLSWESVGSDDTTTETIEITFPSSVTINRLFLIEMNFKEFDVMYDLSSVWTDFTNVLGLDGPLGGGITETTYDKDTAYYEFTPVTTTKVRIRATKTQVVDDEKILRSFIGTEEIGTLQGWPDIKNAFSRNAKTKKAVSGKYAIMKSYDILSRMRVRFKVNPYQNDQNIVEELYDRDFPFLVWPTGGAFGAAEYCADGWFKLQQKGWALSDVYQVQTDGALATNFLKNVYIAGTIFSMSLRESID